LQQAENNWQAFSFTYVFWTKKGLHISFWTRFYNYGHSAEAATLAAAART
jgi:hypothetical protein